MHSNGIPRLLAFQDFHFPILAKSCIKIPVKEIPTLKPVVNSKLPHPFSPTILKNMDDQTLVAMNCILKASKQEGLEISNFKKWGLATSPRHPGRRRLLTTFKKFEREGAWIVSPHSVTYDALHSPAGLISQAFQINGPCIGAGGLAGLEGQAILAATSLFHLGKVDAVWAVITLPEQETASSEQPESFPEQLFAFAIALGKPESEVKDGVEAIHINHSRVEENQTTKLTSQMIQKICDSNECPWWFHLSDGCHAKFSGFKKEK